MPALNEGNVRHLLRRTEFVDRPARVEDLLALASMEAAVDDVMATSPPPSVTFSSPENWVRGEELTHFWLDRMARTSTRPLDERMSFFWHGHFCSEFGKVGDAVLMRQQIDLFRTNGLGNLRQLAKDMSIQVAMLRYLDNNQNHKNSPNQNFGRELLELFLLEVGNYTEADVEASTAAWTGHTDNWETGQYVWRSSWHDFSSKTFLGRTINSGPDGTAHGFDVIDTVLGNGIVPAGAAKVPNRGRPSRDVAAEFLSRKLWQSFGDTAPSADVIATLRDALVAGDFEIRPWLRAMLLHDEFYSDRVKAGLVRTPTELVVALLVASGQPSKNASPLWLMEGMGQRPLFPPNVSGWRPNGYWVNASAMEGRAQTAQMFFWRCMRTYWDANGSMQLAGGTIPRSDVTAQSGGVRTLSDTAFIDRILELTALRVSPTTRTELIKYSAECSVWERSNALLLVFLAPELHLA